MVTKSVVIPIAVPKHEGKGQLPYPPPDMQPSSNSHSKPESQSDQLYHINGEGSNLENDKEEQHKDEAEEGKNEVGEEAEEEDNEVGEEREEEDNEEVEEDQDKDKNEVHKFGDELTSAFALPFTDRCPCFVEGNTNSISKTPKPNSNASRLPLQTWSVRICSGISAAWKQNSPLLWLEMPRTCPVPNPNF